MPSMAQQKVECYSSHGGFWYGKYLVFDQNCNQRQQIKKVVNNEICATTAKWVRILAYAIQDNMPKIEDKHFVFKTSIAEIHMCLLIDNSCKAKLIDKFFVHTHGVITFKLKIKIKIELKNGKIMQWLHKACLVVMQPLWAIAILGCQTWCLYYGFRRQVAANIQPSH